MKFHYRQLVYAALWALPLLLGWRLIHFSLASVQRQAPGFVAAYTAARLLREGANPASFYDDEWFMAQVGRFEPGLGDIYVNPPTTTLLMLPLAGLNYGTARLIWTVFNLFLLALILWWLGRALAFRGPWAPAFITFVLLYQPLYANFYFGQVYVFLLGWLIVAWHGYRQGRDAWLGLALGTMLVLKVAGVLLWPLLLAQRRWRALAWATATALIVILLSLPWLGLPAWLRHVEVILSLGSQPERSVTAYQTLVSFFSHLLIFDSRLNPQPLFLAPALGLWLPWLGFALLIGVSALWAYPAGRNDLVFAAFVILSLILSPLALDYHYPLLLLPVAVLLAWARRQPRLWPWLILAAGVTLIALDLPYRSPRLAAGAWALLAYPKLYGALLLWVLALLASSRPRFTLLHSVAGAVRRPARARSSP